jgi:hypothetical protein
MSDVKAIRANFALRTAVAVLVFLGFVVLSNHCALSEMLARHTETKQETDSGCCHKSSAPPKEQPLCPQLPSGCCKTLKVTMPDGAKVPGEPVTAMVPMIAEWLETLILPLTDKDPIAPGTGPPPDVPGFVELVLHRSLRAHAPPFAA